MTSPLKNSKETNLHIFAENPILDVPVSEKLLPV